MGRRIARMRRALGAALLMMGLAGPLAAQEPLTLNRDQAVLLARQAYMAGDYLLANQIARRILTVLPEDPAALLLFAATGPELGEARLARQSGAAAWALAGAGGAPDQFRYEIARHTAHAALVEGRPMISEYWLRRAVDVAPDAAARGRSTQDLRDLRARRKFSAQASLSLEPSTNLNAGSSGGLLLIDDSYYIGPISVTGQALSGLRLRYGGMLSWRLAPTAAGQTELSLSARGALHSLSPASRRAIAADRMLSGSGFDSSDLNEFALEAGLRRSFALPWGPEGMAGQAGLSLGHDWAGGQALGPYVSAALVLPVLAGPEGRLDLVARLRAQAPSTGSTTFARSLQIEASHKLGPGQLRLGFGLAGQSRAGDINATYDQITARIGYAIDRIGPFRIEALAIGSLRDQDDFRLGPLAVTDGRHDQRLDLSLTLGLPDKTFLGLEPQATLTGVRVRSNISRYTVDEVALGFGLAARF